MFISTDSERLSYFYRSNFVLQYFLMANIFGIVVPRALCTLIVPYVLDQIFFVSTMVWEQARRQLELSKYRTITGRIKEQLVSDIHRW